MSQAMADLSEMDGIAAARDDARATKFFERQGKLWERRERARTVESENSSPHPPK